MSRHAVRATVAVAALSFAVLSSPIQAQDKPSAQEFTDLHALAEAGDTEAQYNLGLMYFNGRGVAQDDVEAVAWYRQAAGQGHAKAQTRLGVMYDTGKGVAQDDVEAVAWYRQAAEQGIAEAQYWLGYILARSAGNGGVPEDDAEAVRWYRRAAEQGLAGAQFNLGQMYELGRGVTQDDAEAAAWYRLAAEQGDPSAQDNLGVMYGTRRGVPQDDAEAVRWFHLAAEQGDADAQYNLGVMYDIGRGVPQDDAEAVRWYRLAAEQGHASGQRNLGLMYSNGRGVPQDHVSAHMCSTLPPRPATRMLARPARISLSACRANRSPRRSAVRGSGTRHTRSLDKDAAGNQTRSAPRPRPAGRRAAGPATGSRLPLRRGRSRSACVVNGRLRHTGKDAVQPAPPCVVSRV